MSLLADVLLDLTAHQDATPMPSPDLLRNAQDAVAALAAAYWPTPGYASIVVAMPNDLPSVVIPVTPRPAASPAASPAE